MSKQCQIMEHTLVHDQNRRVEIIVPMREVGIITMTNQTMPPTQSNQREKVNEEKKQYNG